MTRPRAARKSSRAIARPAFAVPRFPALSRCRREISRWVSSAVNGHAMSPVSIGQRDVVLTAQPDSIAGWATADCRRENFDRTSFDYGPAHRAQRLAETQGGRVLALGKVGAEVPGCVVRHLPGSVRPGA